MEVVFPFSNQYKLEFKYVLLNKIIASSFTVCYNKKFDPAFGNVYTSYNPLLFDVMDFNSDCHDLIELSEHRENIWNVYNLSVDVLNIRPVSRKLTVFKTDLHIFIWNSLRNWASNTVQSTQLKNALQI